MEDTYDMHLISQYFERLFPDPIVRDNNLAKLHRFSHPMTDNIILIFYGPPSSGRSTLLRMISHKQFDYTICQEHLFQGDELFRVINKNKFICITSSMNQLRKLNFNRILIIKFNEILSGNYNERYNLRKYLLPYSDKFQGFDELPEYKNVYERFIDDHLIPMSGNDYSITELFSKLRKETDNVHIKYLVYALLTKKWKCELDIIKDATYRD